MSALTGARTRALRLAGTAATLLVALAVAGCCASAAQRHPAALATDAALRLRSSLATDPAAYVPYFESSEVATELASAARAATGTASPIPAWDTPYASKAASSTAEVVVVWHGSDRFVSWPKATRFTLKLIDGRWVIADASEIASAAPPPIPEK